MKISFNINTKIFNVFKLIGKLISNLFVLLYALFIRIEIKYKIIAFIAIIIISIFADRYNILFSDELYHVNIKVIDKFELRDNYGNDYIKIKAELIDYHIIKMMDIDNEDEERLNIKIGKIYKKPMSKADIYNSWFYSTYVNYILLIITIIFIYVSGFYIIDD